MASSSHFPCKVKKEMDDDSDQASHSHSHSFNVQFENNIKHVVNCERLCTVLDAMRANEKVKEKLTCADEQIMIQMGTGDDECTIATHFPCTLLQESVNLRVSQKKETIERKAKEDLPISPKTDYAVFYIDKDLGQNARTKQIFRSQKNLKASKYVCIYGENETTVEEALRRDGRFVDDLGFFSFYLENIEDKDERNERRSKVKFLHGKKFKICMEKMSKLQGTPEGKGSDKLQGTPEAKGRGKLQGTPGVSEVAFQKGVSVIRSQEQIKDSDLEEVRQRLREQFPELKEQLDKRFRQRAFEELLELKKENFGKIQQSFSEVHRVRKLLELSKSVCKIVITEINITGTGFVLFEDLILTNKHLFEKVNQGDHLKIYALFDFEIPQPETDYCVFLCENELIDSDKELDYAVLKLCTKTGERSQPQSRKTVEVPPGLLSKFGPVPLEGEACIIGHPQGDVKKMDPTCIIEKEQRIQATNDHMSQYKDAIFIIQSVIQQVKNQGIEKIMREAAVTYNTFMYHGASGSPVFDQSGQVFGLHTAGFIYEWPKKESVIEFAHPLLHIFNKFVSKLREKKDDMLLARITEEAKGNSYLIKVLDVPHTPEPAGTPEPMDIN